MAHGADLPHLPVRHKGLLTLAVMAAVVMQVLDSTIANVALPHMEAALGATPESITWVLTSYIVAAAMAIPLSGWLASRIGTRRLFLLSVVTFIVASMLCGLARSLPMMVAARILQGVGGAFLSPLGQSIMFNINRPSEHGKAMAYYGMGMMVGPIVGPMLGGWLTDQFDWRWVFFINVPFGLVALVGLAILLPRSDESPRRVDLLGWALIATAVGSFQLLLDRGERVDWFNSTESWIEAGLAASALWMFLVHSATVRLPLFPPAILRDRNLLTGCLFMMMIGMVQLSGMALLPSLLQTLLGYPVMTAGVVLGSRGICMMAAMWLAGRLVRWCDARLLIGIGMVLVDYSLWEMTSWSLDMDWRPIVINGAIQGLGMGLLYVPLSVLTFGTLPPRLRTDGAGLFSLARNVGGSTGIAVATVMFARNSQVSHADLGAHLTPYNLPADPTLLNAAGDAGAGVVSMINGIVSRQAAMIAYLDDFKMLMIGGIAALPLLLLARRPAAANEPVIHATE